MALHMLKMCVGIDSLPQLRARQAERLESRRAAGEPAVLVHLTRNMPRRASEIAGQGSLYWIIKGAICVRQPVVALEPAGDRSGLKRCAILLGPELVETVPRAARPMQGWRYLEAADAPPDRETYASPHLPPDMEQELRELGLL